MQDVTPWQCYVGTETWIGNVRLQSEARLSSEFTKTGTVWCCNDVKPVTACILDSFGEEEQ